MTFKAIQIFHTFLQLIMQCQLLLEAVHTAMRRSLRRWHCRSTFKFACIAALILLIGAYNYCKKANVSQPTSSTLVPGTMKSYTIYKNITLPRRDYLVWSNSCRIQTVEPFKAEVLRDFKPLSPMNCSDGPRYVYKMYEINSRKYFLYLNMHLKHRFVSENDSISCCYEQILRAGTEWQADKSFTLLPCLLFDDGFEVPLAVDYIIVTCKSVASQKIVSQDAFFFIQERPDIELRLKEAQQHNRSVEPPFGILLLGMDSMSQFNFRRNMPRTFDYLKRRHWFELSGYNKIGENTFPNLMALLAGYNETQVAELCKTEIVGGLDECPLLLKLFRERGFVTAYGEDETPMNTFNYLRKGFLRPPTDYYLQPFMMAAERHLESKKQAGMQACLGPTRAVEYIYDFALEFGTRYGGKRAFGLFWANSASHNDYRTASSMDGRMLQYLQEFERRGILDNMVTILFSDHGIRWGFIRNLPEGFLEERMPAFFMWLPKNMQRRHSEFVYALQANRHRLSSPFDVHLTLKQFLSLATGEMEALDAKSSCPTCQSVLQPLPVERSCLEAGIAEHWCTCTNYHAIPTYDTTVRKYTLAVIRRINEFIRDRKLAARCHTLELHDLLEANKKAYSSPNENLAHSATYRVRFDVVPKIKHHAEFETTLVYDADQDEIEVDVESISRLNMYADDSACIDDKLSKKFCICV